MFMISVTQVMEAIRLNRNEHHRKLSVLISDISSWLVNILTLQISATPCRVWR